MSSYIEFAEINFMYVRGDKNAKKCYSSSWNPLGGIFY